MIEQLRGRVGDSTTSQEQLLIKLYLQGINMDTIQIFTQIKFTHHLEVLEEDLQQKAHGDIHLEKIQVSTKANLNQ